MNVLQQARYGIDSYMDWLKAEGLRVVEGLAIDCTQVETADSKSSISISSATLRRSRASSEVPTSWW